MSLTFHKIWHNETRLVVQFRFACAACGATQIVEEELVLHRWERKQVLLPPPPPATWRSVGDTHYCSRHELNVVVKVTPAPRLRLPLEE